MSWQEWPPQDARSLQHRGPWALLGHFPSSEAPGNFEGLGQPLSHQAHTKAFLNAGPLQARPQGTPFFVPPHPTPPHPRTPPPQHKHTEETAHRATSGLFYSHGLTRQGHYCQRAGHGHPGPALVSRPPPSLLRVSASYLTHRTRGGGWER